MGYTFFSIVIEQQRHPCNPSPCGSNAICKERNGAGSCICMQDYFGDPYIGCKPECLMNNDCPTNKACLTMKCKDPCPGSCGLNADCRVINHSPSCFCLNGYTGNALSVCKKIETRKNFSILCVAFILPNFYFSLN